LPFLRTLKQAPYKHSTSRKHWRMSLRLRKRERIVRVFNFDSPYLRTTGATPFRQRRRVVDGQDEQRRIVTPPETGEQTVRLE